MKFGLNMLLWTTFVTKKNLPQLKLVKSAGADGVEIPIMEGQPDHYRELGGMLDDVGLERTSCMAFTDPTINPVSPERKHRQAAIDNLKWLVDCAAALGSPVVAGPMYQTLGMFTGQGPTADEKKRVVEVLRAAAGPAQQAGVVLALEPLNRFESYVCNTLADGADIVKKVNHPNVGVLFDTFHANIEEKDPVGCIRKHGKVIKHFHACANDRGIPGEDHIDWQGTFKALRAVQYDAWTVMEPFGRALPGLAAATKIWRDMFPTSESVARKGFPFVKKQWQKSAA